MKPETKESLDRYATQGVPTGDFLRAVLSNDLTEAFGRADDDNRRDMYDICSYVYNELPSPCHGSPEKVTAWIQRFKAARELQRLLQDGKKVRVDDENQTNDIGEGTNYS